MAKKNPHPASVRNKHTASVKDVIDAMLKSYNLEKRFDQANISTAWEKIMGSAIANRTDHIEMRDSVLIVKLNSAPLKQELNAAKHKVIELITKEFGRRVVKDVLFI
ncbi:DUF721 domain-containing protein [Reichenbachiella versicolor]|uniref:DUF721 domain-containing protein n=1 Tax=Reichenbachiella versicolor TaxID=1821036 RepID=UPI000D6E0E65|nr:DUF721 domain-containing protein [Reichenbachiella versicolor]